MTLLIYIAVYKLIELLETPKAFSTIKCENLKDVTMDNQQVSLLNKKPQRLSKSKESRVLFKKDVMSL